VAMLKDVAQKRQHLTTFVAADAKDAKQINAITDLAQLYASTVKSNRAYHKIIFNGGPT
jgi:hypothetical protein